MDGMCQVRRKHTYKIKVERKCGTIENLKVGYCKRRWTS